MRGVPELFDAQRNPDPLRSLLEVDAPWKILHAMDAFLTKVTDGVHGAELASIHPTAIIEGDVWLGVGVTVEPFAWIRGPAWIGAGVTIGHSALLRGGCILADGAAVGHASEVKHSLLFAGAKAPHFNYVGDAILGAGVNLGAGVKIANLRNDGAAVRVGTTTTGLRKFGGALGDDVHVGCNAVLGPGALVGARTSVYAGAVVRGVIEADQIVKHRGVHEVVPREGLVPAPRMPS